MTEQSEKTIIKIAILAEEPFFWCSRKHYHKLILDRYQWRGDEKRYEFHASYIYDKDIIKGSLTTERYDVLLIPGGGVGNNEALLKGLSFLPKVKRFKTNLRDFVLNGGGIMGICGGAALITDISFTDQRKPRSLTEKLYHKSNLGISCVSSQFKAVAFPLFYPFQKSHPEGIGNSAYAFSFAAGQTKDGKQVMTTGCPLDIQLNKNNPIFSDYEKDTRRMRWWAAQSLEIKNTDNRTINIIARYPPYDVSQKERTRIHYWRYTGGILGFFRAFIKAIELKKTHQLNRRLISLFTYYLAGDWEPTEKIISLDMANKPCITSEIYPNEHQGRIVLNMLHAEYLIWYEGSIVEQENTDHNCLGKGLHYWKDIKPLSKKLDELHYNWWIHRRLIAWAGKVPDKELPPPEKGKITSEMNETILANLFWDGTLFHQLRNI